MTTAILVGYEYLNTPEMALPGIIFDIYRLYKFFTGKLDRIHIVTDIYEENFDSILEFFKESNIQVDISYFLNEVERS